MSAKAISEQTGKEFLYKHICTSAAVQNRFKYASVTTDTDWDRLAQDHPWVLTERLVVKPDQLIKRRGKLGLVGVNLDLQGVKEWLKPRLMKETMEEEFYVCIYASREGDHVLFHHEGGVDIGDVDSKAQKFLVGVDEKLTEADVRNHLLGHVPAHKKDILASFVVGLFNLYEDLYFTYLEINPLVVTKDGVYVLDMAAKIDATADYICKAKWGDVEFPPPFGREAYPEEEEFYVCIYASREGDHVLFHHEGGVDIGDVDSKAQKFLVGVDEKLTEADVRNHLLGHVPAHKKDILASFVVGLFNLYEDLYFTYLEINPLVVTKDGVYVLDMAAKIDATADYICKAKWGDVEFPPPFGREAYPEEAYIADLDAKSGASLKLTILNPRGRIWTMVAGGGASVVYSDTICDLGGVDELANYGEYSGAPSEQQTYDYAKTILSLMTREKHNDGKVLIIGGSIANFTNVAATFKGIVRAIRDYQVPLKEHEVTIFVRRGGPNYQEGLRVMGEVGKTTGIPIHVFGTETHMTAIVGMALGHRPIPNQPPTAAHTANFLLNSSGSASTPATSRTASFSETKTSSEATPAKKPKPGVPPAKATTLFSSHTKSIVWGMQTRAVQGMLDFDYICSRVEPSVAAMVYPFTGDHKQKFYWGHKEILIPVFKSMADAMKKHPKVDVLINFASLRSAFDSSMETMQYPQIHTIAIIAEGIPEAQTRKLIKKADEKGVTIIGPATVRTPQKNKAAVLLKTVQRSPLRESALNDRDHVLRYQDTPGVKMLVVLGEIGGSEEYRICQGIKEGRITKPVVSWCIGTCATMFSSEATRSKPEQYNALAYVSRSGGMSNELNNIISRTTDGVFEGVAIGGDRYPGSTFMDHVLRYQDTPGVKMLVVLGEIGGSEEYRICQGIKEGRITKPVVSWCIGTCATMFSSEASKVQFGHAGACANQASETAVAKNEALREAGAFVPKSFDELGDAIKSVYDELVAEGVIVPAKEVPPPTVPMDYSWARFIEMCLMVTADHGPAVSGAHNTIVCARAGKDLISSLTSGLLTIGDRFGGALDAAARQFSKAFDSSLIPMEFVNKMKKEGKLIMGIGHRVKSINNPDMRVQILKDFVKQNFPATPLLDYALEVEKITTSKGDRFGGALDAAARQFSKAFDSSLIPMEFVNKMKKEGKLIMGIGHRVKSINNPDMRVQILKDFVKQNFPATPLLDYALEVEKITTSKKPNLILNVDGFIGVAFVDLLRTCGGFTREEADEYVDIGALNGIFVLGRSMGFIAVEQ
ncbi:UNVERIFIED_CONTAM: hypothetical protein FKN15_057094 [Acipenser sinensis]